MPRFFVTSLALVLALAAGCTDGANSLDGDGGLGDGSANSMDGSMNDGGLGDDAGEDGSTSGDAIIPPGSEVPAWLSDCEREQILHKGA